MYVLIISYTLCFRLLFVLFLYWFKVNTFISHLYFSYHMNFYLIFYIFRRSIRLILLLSLSYTIICFNISFHVFSYTIFFIYLSLLSTFYPFRVLYFVLSIYCIHVMFLYYFHISIFMYCSFPIFPYLVYFHITYLILSCIFIYILILFLYDTFVCFNLVLFIYCTFICLLLVYSLSSFIYMTYYILCTITYIIYYPIPI